MTGQGELFPVIEIDDDLLEKICRVLKIDYEELFYSEVWRWPEVDEFVCDAIRDYMRRYVKEGL
jgi:Arc/MetJ family transcription regulator